ncbi:MAG: hypothetical protein WBO97_10235, partial [Tepidiformaceae bacterium]
MAPPTALMDALVAPVCSPLLADLDRRTLLTGLIPELEAGRGFTQPELHYYDVLDHNMAAVAALDAVLGDGEDNHELREALGWIDLDESLSGEIEGLALVAMLRL